MPKPNDIRMKASPAVVLVVTVAFVALLAPGHSSAQNLNAFNDTGRTRAAAVESPRIIRADYRTILEDASSGKSRLAVVNMWSTWCAPCIEEFPDFINLAKQYDSTKVRVLFVSVDFEEQLPDVRRFLARHNWDRVSYFKNQKDNEFVRGFGESWTGAVPATFVYDSKGVLLWFAEGKTTFSALNSVIQSNVD